MKVLWLIPVYNFIKLTRIFIYTKLFLQVKNIRDYFLLFLAGFVEESHFSDLN